VSIQLLGKQGESIGISVNESGTVGISFRGRDELPMVALGVRQSPKKEVVLDITDAAGKTKVIAVDQS
jgi:hypothetical protein